MEQKVYGIYHSRDLDGYCSGAIIKKRYPNAILIGYDYGQEFDFDAIECNSIIIMADVSMPMDKMHRLAKISGLSFTWIDHHISAINDYKNYISNVPPFCTAVLESGISACEGTWKHLFPNIAMPKAVKLLGEYDTWRNNDKERWEQKILPFQFGMRVQCNSPETFSKLLLKPNNEHVEQWITGIILNGRIILKYQAQINSFNCKRAFEFNFHGLRAICVNGGAFNSEAFKSIYNEDRHDVMMPFQYDGKQWVVSMYTTKEIDLSVIAKTLGGGGHAKACGFQAKSITDVFPFID